jgi:hypothetical protein
MFGRKKADGTVVRTQGRDAGEAGEDREAREDREDREDPEAAEQEALEQQLMAEAERQWEVATGRAPAPACPTCGGPVEVGGRACQHCGAALPAI